MANITYSAITVDDGKVGVNNPVPVYPLDVIGATNTRGLRIDGLYSFGASSSQGIEMNMSSTSYNAMRFFQGLDWTGVIHSFGRAWSGGVSVGMINIEGYNGVSLGSWANPISTFKNSGDVGIGTVNPIMQLHINKAGGTGVFISNTTNDIGGYLYAGTGGLEIQGVNSTNSGVRNIIMQSYGGNIGINVTSPGYKLSVGGDVHMTDTLRIEKGASDSVQQGSSIYLMGGSGASYTQLQQGVGRFTIWGFNGSGWYETLTIDNSTGEVGIGTDNPDGGLSGNERGLLIYDDNVAHLSLQCSNGGKWAFYTAPGDKLYCFSHTLVNNAWVADSTGKVGFGTDSPAAKIHSNSSYFFVGGSDGMLKMKSVATTYGSETVILQTTIDGRTDDYTASTFGGEERHCLVLQPDGGRVGIRAITPQHPLHVNGKIYSNTNVQGGAAQIGTYGGYAMFGSNSLSVPLAFGRDGTQTDMIIDYQGNIGIGNTSPWYYGGYKMVHIGDSTYRGLIKFGTGISDNGPEIYADASPTSNRLFINTNSVTTAMIMEGSDVGVGMFPSYKLDIDGMTRHKGLVMTSGTNIDQENTFAQILQLVAGTWIDTGINGVDLDGGTHIVQVYVNDWSVGGQQYSETYSGVMSWFSANTNSSASDVITLHRAGHAPNSGVIELRTQRTSSADPNDLKLQIKGNISYSSPQTINFKFRKLLS
jgi:hypothetical protein